MRFGPLVGVMLALLSPRQDRPGASHQCGPDGAHRSRSSMAASRAAFPISTNIYRPNSPKRP